MNKSDKQALISIPHVDHDYIFSMTDFQQNGHVTVSSSNTNISKSQRLLGILLVEGTTE